MDLSDARVERGEEALSAVGLLESSSMSDHPEQGEAYAAKGEIAPECVDIEKQAMDLEHRGETQTSEVVVPKGFAAETTIADTEGAACKGSRGFGQDKLNAMCVVEIVATPNRKRFAHASRAEATRSQAAGCDEQLYALRRTRAFGNSEKECRSPAEISPEQAKSGPDQAAGGSTAARPNGFSMEELDTLAVVEDSKVASLSNTSPVGESLRRVRRLRAFSQPIVAPEMAAERAIHRSAASADWVDEADHDGGTKPLTATDTHVSHVDKGVFESEARDASPLDTLLLRRRRAKAFGADLALQGMAEFVSISDRDGSGKSKAIRVTDSALEKVKLASGISQQELDALSQCSEDACPNQRLGSYVWGA